MEEYISSSLTREQLLDAVKKIDLLLDNSQAEEEGALVSQISHLEERLAEEKLIREQLEERVQAIVQTTSQVTEEVRELQQTRDNWRKKWLLLNASNEETKALLEEEQVFFNTQHTLLHQQLQATQYELKLYRGEDAALAALPLPGVLAMERRVMQALRKVHRKKTQLLTTTSERQCVVCHARALSVRTEPCNHVCLCLHCLSNVDKCPLCRKLITKYEQVFFE